MGKGAEQVDMHIVEACDGANRYFIVALFLSALAQGAAPRPLANNLLQSLPNQLFHVEANGGFVAGMDKIM